MLTPVDPAAVCLKQGETLAEGGRHQEAIAAFTKELELRHNRSESLLGLARALLASGDSKGAVEAYSRLLSNWKNADRDLPAAPRPSGWRTQARRHESARDRHPEL